MRSSSAAISCARGVVELKRKKPVSVAIPTYSASAAGRIGTPAGARHQLEDDHGRGTGGVVQDRFPPRRAARRVVVDAERLLGQGAQLGLQAAEAIGGGVVEEHRRSASAKAPACDAGVVDLDGEGLRLQEAQRLRRGVLVDDAHLRPLRAQEAGQTDLRSDGIAVGVDVRGEQEPATGVRRAHRKLSWARASIIGFGRSGSSRALAT